MAVLLHPHHDVRLHEVARIAEVAEQALEALVDEQFVFGIEFAVTGGGVDLHGLPRRASPCRVCGARRRPRDAGIRPPAGGIAPGGWSAARGTWPRCDARCADPSRAAGPRGVGRTMAPSCLPPRSGS